MSFLQHDEAPASVLRAVTTPGGCTERSQTDRHRSAISLETPSALSLADALLGAVTRMRDTRDPEEARHVVAVEALRFQPADGAIVLAHDKNGLTPAYHLPRAGSRVCADRANALCLRLAAAQLLEPGRVPARALHRAQQASAAGADVDDPPCARWRSVLVADLDHPRSSRSTRLLWYATTGDAFTTTSDLAVLFARHAGLALHDVTERHHLQRAIEGRTVTGQATGILMHRYQLRSEQAFEIIRRYSQEHNLKLRDVAEAINQTGQLPT